MTASTAIGRAMDAQTAKKMRRGLEAARLRESGLTWAQVGEQVGLSATRARQLGLAASSERGQWAAKRLGLIP